MPEAPAASPYAGKMPHAPDGPAQENPVGRGADTACPRACYTFAMGYIVILVLAVALVPILIALFKPNSEVHGAGRVQRRPEDPPPERTEPSADQPTPQADTINQASPEVERRLPPA